MGLEKAMLLTPALLEKSFQKYPAWKMWALVCINNLLCKFDTCNNCHKHKINILGRGKPVRPYCFCGKCGASYPMSVEQIDKLHNYLWCHDSGFDLLDKGIEAMASVMNISVDPEVKDWIGENPNFTTAWSKIQHDHLHKVYGLTEIDLT